MSDMKKKIGKSGLKGLLNKKEPDPPARSDGYASDYRRNYGRSDLYGGPVYVGWEDDDSDRLDWRSTPVRTPKEPAPRTNGLAAGKTGGPMVYENTSGEIVVVSKREMERIAKELTENLIANMRRRGMLVPMMAEISIATDVESIVATDARILIDGRRKRIVVDGS